MHLQILSGDYLFSSPSGEPSGYFGLLTAGFAVLFLAGAFAYIRRAKLAPDNPILRRFIRRISSAAMWTSGIGLFLALMRYVQLDYIDEPIWMLLLLLSMIALVGYYVYDYSERYPIATWRLQTSAAQREFRAPPRRRTSGAKPVRPNNMRGKRRR